MPVDENNQLRCQPKSILSVFNNGIEVSIFPNPANSVITIEAYENQNLPAGFLKIFDVYGKLVREVEIPKNQLSFELNISDLNEGLYMGRIIGSDSENWSFTFVKN